MEVDRLNKKKQRATRDGNLPLLAEVVKDLGDLYFGTGKLTEALEEYIQQSELCIALNDKLNSAVAHRMIGEVHASLGNYEKALIHQQRYLDGAQEMGNILEEQRAWTTLGRTYFCLAESLLSDDVKKEETLANAEKAFASGIRLCQELEATNLEPKELITMRARLLLNLGLVREVQKKREEAINLIEKAAALCEDHGLREDLYRTKIAAAGIYERHGDYATAVSSLRDACQIDNPSLKAEASLLKTEVLLKAERWQEARKLLVSMYVSDQIPSKVKRKSEKLLRIVVTLQSTTQDLDKEKDPRKQLKLYERLGDAAVSVKCFDKAVHYYTQMLRLAEENDQSQKSAALVSLAQTLKDLGCYTEAVVHARNELKLCTDSRDICRSALFLADLLSDTTSSEFEIREVYDLAMTNAKLSGDATLEKQVLNDLTYYLQSFGNTNEAECLRQSYELFNTQGVDDEELSTENGAEASDEDDGLLSAEIGADICLDTLSDIECELERTGVSKKGPRRRPKRVVFKKNEKGESRLHVACISGNVEEVGELLRHGHPIEVRDHFGWTPLHEAANHGFVDIAKLLLENGAKVNDRGGPLCQGVTPLHDAASCGNIDMVLFLLNSGADITLRTSDGDRAAECLEQWKDRVGQLSPKDFTDYLIAHRKLTANAGKEPNDNKNLERNERRLIEKRENLEETTEKLSAREVYKRTIASLRHRNDPIGRSCRGLTAPKLAKPLVDSQEQVDDWLEDDLKHCSAKTKHEESTTEGSTSCERHKRKSYMIDAASKESMKRQKLSFCSEDDTSPYVSETELDTNHLYDIDGMTQVSSYAISNITAGTVDKTIEKQRNQTRKRQASLFSAGFTTHVTPVVLSTETTCAKIVDYSQNTETITFTALVDEKSFKIEMQPVSGDSNILLNMSSKIKEKFLQVTGCEVTLNIKTINGIAFAPEDMTQVAASGNVETVLCEIVQSTVPLLSQRYETICRSNNVVVRETVLQLLKSCETNFTLRVDQGNLSRKELECVLRALEYQRSIQIIQLSSYDLCHAGPYLKNCCAKFLNLRELYLDRCDLNTTCLKELGGFPKCLKLLDLSYNPLGIESQGFLEELLLPLQDLQTLSLQYCELEDFRIPLSMTNLVDVDLSWNTFSIKGFKNLMQKHLLRLNLTGTIPKGAPTDLVEFSNPPLNNSCLLNLEYLEMAYCNVTDTQLQALLSQAKSLTKIVLTGNSGITAKTANLLLSEHSTLTYINLAQCAVIKCHPNIDIFLANPQTCTFLANIVLDVQHAWLKLWRENCIMQNLAGNLVLFKPLNESKSSIHRSINAI